MKLDDAEHEAYVDLLKSFSSFQAHLAIALTQGFKVELSPNSDIGLRPVLSADQIQFYATKEWPEGETP